MWSIVLVLVVVLDDFFGRARLQNATSRRPISSADLPRLIRGAKQGRAGGWMRQTFRCVPVPSPRIGYLVRQAQSSVLLPRPTPGSALLLQLLRGPTVAGRLCWRLVAFWSLALPKKTSRTRTTTSTRTMCTALPTFPRDPGDLGARGAFNGVDSL